MSGHGRDRPAKQSCPPYKEQTARANYINREALMSN